MLRESLQIKTARLKLSQRRRRDIFIETQIKNSPSPGGAAYSLPEDFAPTELWRFLIFRLQRCQPYGLSDKPQTRGFVA